MLSLRWIFPFNVFARQRDRIAELEALNARLTKEIGYLREDLIKEHIKSTNLTTAYVSALSSVSSSMSMADWVSAREEYARASYEHQKKLAEEISNQSPQRVPHELPRRDAGS
jgi:hypothetical protein